MTFSPVLQLNPDSYLEAAVAELLQEAEQPEVVRWIEFPNSVLLFEIVSGNPQSGAIYAARPQKRTWYAIDFDDQEYGGYDVKQLEALVKHAAS